MQASVHGAPAVQRDLSSHGNVYLLQAYILSMLNALEFGFSVLFRGVIQKAYDVLRVQESYNGSQR